MSTLPFSDEIFYIFLLFAFIIVCIATYSFIKYIPYDKLILIVSIAFIILFFPKPLHLFIFGICNYLLYFIGFKFRNLSKLWMSLLFALPMILVKSEIKYFDISSTIVFAGISYISFRSMSVYFDITDDSKQADFFDFISFLFFIPTILIGPIDRFRRFHNDIRIQGYANLNQTNFSFGLGLIVLGVLQKYILAEFVNRYWLSKTGIAANTDIAMRLSDMFSYFFYLYFDFAGYSSLAVGSSYLMGIKTPENFNAPYLAKNPQEFWQRWHKSLGDWLKDYIFSPVYKWLSGIKKLKAYPLTRQNIALFFTFVLMGFWNGFKFHFILSGAVFGAYSVIHNTYNAECKKKKRDIDFGNLPSLCIVWLCRLIMFVMAAFSLYIFSGRLIH